MDEYMTRGRRTSSKSWGFKSYFAVVLLFLLFTSSIALISIAATRTARCSTIAPVVQNETVKVLPIEKHLVGFWPLTERFQFCDQSQFHNQLADPAFGNDVTLSDGYLQESHGAYYFHGTQNSFLHIDTIYKNPALNLTSSSVTICVYIGNASSSGPMLDFGSSASFGFQLWFVEDRYVQGRALGYNGKPGLVDFGVPVIKYPVDQSWHFTCFGYDQVVGQQMLWVDKSVVSFEKLYKKPDILAMDGQTIDIGKLGSTFGDKRFLKASLTCLTIFNKFLAYSDLLQVEQLCQMTRGKTSTRKPVLNDRCSKLK